MDNEGKKKNKLIVVLIIICLIVLAGILIYIWQMDKSQEDFESIQTFYDEIKPDDEQNGPEQGSYLEDLLVQNDEIVAWLTISGTNIDTPVMYSGDNKYYLSHSFEKEYSGYGVPFLDYRCNTDFADFVSIIYGHNIRNRYVFGELNLFREQDFLDGHNTGILITNDEKFQLNFIACLVAEKEGFLYNDITFLNMEEKQAYIDEILSTAVTKIDYAPEDLAEKQIVVISTCTAHGLETRTALAAYLTEFE